MKRPPGIWLLLSAGALWLSIQNVYGLKATELIFGKTTTTTTTTEIVPEGDHKDGASTETPEESENSIKSNLTGNPQLDYIYDPNLPRELNGYNLSSYPFYNSMPEDIDFKCDGLHDGFYASVPHKCQVYHHCLFGTRYDFLCANYTAFDQKTFICHFVSEVDCNNSHKYWHRNDALYQAATTTTPKPPPIVISPALTAAPRRPSPAVRRRRPSRRRPQYEYYDDDYDEDRDDDYEEPPPRRRRKRPRPRPRPIYEDDYEEYEDDKYERRGSGRHGEGDDRKSYDRREPDDRRSEDDDKRAFDRKEPDDRRKAEDDRKPYDRKGSDDRRNVEEDRKIYERKELNDRRDGNDERKLYDRRESDDRRSSDDRRRDFDDRRYEERPVEGKRYKEDRRRDYDDRGGYNKGDEDLRYDRDRRREDDRSRRPDDDYRDERGDRRPSHDKRPLNERRYEKRKPPDDVGPYDRPRKGHRRPYDDDMYEEDRDDERRAYSRPRKGDNRDDPQPHDSRPSPDNDEMPLVKPNSSSSVFNQPRMPPRIRPPVPKNEQNKFSYKPAAENPAPKKQENDEEYYDYEDEPSPKRPTLRTNRKPEPEASEARRSNKPAPSLERDEGRENRRPLGSASRTRVQMSRRPTADPSDDDENEKPRTRQRMRPRYDLDNRDSKVGLNSRNRPAVEDDLSNAEREDERVLPPKNPSSSRERNTSQVLPKFIQRGRSEFRDKAKPETTTSTTSTTTSTTTKELPRPRPEPVVKVVKRPFLPSRGGNPYSARGLQPVGAKALDNSRTSNQHETDISTKPVDYGDNLEPEVPHTEQKPILKYQLETSKPIDDDYDEPEQSYKSSAAPLSDSDEKLHTSYKPTTEESSAVQNGRQFPTSTESKASSFLINEQPVAVYKRRPSLSEIPVRESSEAKEPEPPEEKPFKPSPILIKVPIRQKYSNPVDNTDEEFRPVSNRPQSALRGNNKPAAYQERRTTERSNIPERNPLDITENEYDVTLNDALNPTIPNLPVRNFPTGFSTAADYTFSTFHRPAYDVTLNQASENRYVRAPSQRVETVVQPYINAGGKQYVNSNAQYDIPSDHIYQNHNFRSSPQITQAQTRAFYNVY